MMACKLAVLGALIVACAFPSTAFAQQDREADLRCVLAFSIKINDAPDDKTRQQGTIGLIYFFGRVDGEAPQTDLQAELERLGKTMTDDDVKAALGPCAERLGARGKYLIDVGSKLQQKGQ